MKCTFYMSERETAMKNKLRDSIRSGWLVCLIFKMFVSDQSISDRKTSSTAKTWRGD